MAQQKLAANNVFTVAKRTVDGQVSVLLVMTKDISQLTALHFFNIGYVVSVVEVYQ